MPDAETWSAIKRRSVERPAIVTITGVRGSEVSRGQVAIRTSKDPVGAPVFYRDVPLMPSELEKGVIKPLAAGALPLIGWLAGLKLKDFMGGVDHWIAFGLLGLIGGKMIWESMKMDSGEKPSSALTPLVLLSLSVATSIDALAVGVSFAFLKVGIVVPILVIGLVTFVLSFLGVMVGNKIGHFFERKIETLGGLILIGIGIKILMDHLA